jgi:hypothetical protein
MPASNAPWLQALVMEEQRNSNGWQTFFEHWGLAITVVVSFLAFKVLEFFTQLSDAPWIWCYVFAISVAVTGITLLFYAKLPLYRERRFFTFSSQALPESRRSFYRWGYRCVIFAVVLLLCLMLSKS